MPISPVVRPKISERQRRQVYRVPIRELSLRNGGRELRRSVSISKVLTRRHAALCVLEVCPNEIWPRAALNRQMRYAAQPACPSHLSKALLLALIPSF